MARGQMDLFRRCPTESQTAQLWGLCSLGCWLTAARCHPDGRPCRHTPHRSAPAAFYSIYKVPPEYRTDSEWHRHLPGDTLCTPYDPLLVLVCVHPDLFEPVHAGPRLQHRLIGNIAAEHGVPDPAATHTALRGLIELALTRQ